MTSDPKDAERLAEHVDGWRKARAMAREMGVKASYTDECVDRLLIEIDRLTQERDEARRSAEMLKARYGYTEPAIEAAERRGRQQATDALAARDAGLTRWGGERKSRRGMTRPAS